MIKFVMSAPEFAPSAEVESCLLPPADNFTPAINIQRVKFEGRAVVLFLTVEEIHPHPCARVSILLFGLFLT